MPEITIHGSVARADGSVGEYTVPAVVIYPRGGGNGVGVVDWLNCAFEMAIGQADFACLMSPPWSSAGPPGLRLARTTR
jgi:hypothetical protein